MGVYKMMLGVVETNEGGEGRGIAKMEDTSVITITITAIYGLAMAALK